jgi:hypothetical protein
VLIEYVFLDAARELLRSGIAEPNDVLIMQHASSHTEALRANIGIAAKLTIEERDDGPHSIRFVAWKPLVAVPRKAKSGPRNMTAVSAPVR